MKVLIISTVSYARDGISSVIRNLYTSNSFVAKDITFLFPASDQHMKKELEDLGCNVIVNGNRFKKPLKYFRDLTRLIKSEAFDLVHIHGNSHTLVIELAAARLAKCPIRITHAHSTKCNSLLMHKLLAPLFNALCTHRFACGLEAGKFLYGKKEFTVINNGIHLERFCFSDENRTEIKNKYNIQDKIVIGSIANFVEAKNHTFMLDVLNDLSKKGDDYVLMLVGQGPLFETVKEKAEKLNLNDKVLFVGSTPDAYKYLSAMDVFILPSHHEGVPLVLIEAQSNGLKCIASTNVSPEVNITNEIDFLSVTDGTSIWVNAIEETDNIENRFAASSCAIDKITDAGYDVNAQAERLLNYYREFTS